ncbi:ComF family protein [Stenotrophomonas geniculata]|jgi:ComF family protein|uniref:ComF family protein n=1 Tax=Stenotrophomonas geniculata TaxID=86188 RepID=UPI001F52F6C6|nr:ComF family protein [Stenotrophomonas geniculata]MCI1111654.1 ComF family protein [Stenotrophomonas maltophilia]MDC7799948.1 ComF family protein [Stenotrophomonas geniculata]
MRTYLLRSATRVSRALLGVLLPLRCLVCGDPGHDDLDLCWACLADLPWAGRACLRCALPLPDTALIVCGTCREEVPPQAATHASLLYLPPVDQLLVRYKFHQDLAAGRLLAQLMQRAPPPGWCPPLVPVPLHNRRLRQRGYNQAGELCRLLPMPVWQGLYRRRHTAPQSERTAEQRRENLFDAFDVRGSVPSRLTVVDDVMTTGSTVMEVAETLRLAGAAEVRVWVCARAP